jgi:hypothetical protein
MLNKIKKILAVILIFCTCLPLSRCEEKTIKEFAPQDQVDVGKIRAFQALIRKMLK